MLKKWGISIDVLILFTVTYAPPRGQTHSMGLPPKDRGLSFLFFCFRHLITASQHPSISHQETHCSVTKCHLHRHCSAELTCHHCITTAGRGIQTDVRNVITRSQNISIVINQARKIKPLLAWHLESYKVLYNVKLDTQ